MSGAVSPRAPLSGPNPRGWQRTAARSGTTGAGASASEAPQSTERPTAERLSERAERPLDFGIIARLIRCTAPYRRLRNWLLVLVVLRSLQLPVLQWITAKVISGPIKDHHPWGIVLGVAGYVFWSGSTAGCFVYRSRFALQLGEYVVRDLRHQIYEHLLRLPMSYFHRTELGRLLGRTMHDVDSVRTGVQDVFFVSVVQCGSMAISAGLMAHYDWPLFAVVLAMAPGLWVVTRHFRKRTSVAYRARSESFARVTASLAESVNGIREIQSFTRQERNAAAFAERITHHADLNMEGARLAAVFQPVLGFNGQFFLALLLILGGYQVLAHHVALDALIQFLFLSTSFFNGIPIVGDQYNQALTAMAGAERVFRLLDTQPDWQDRADGRDFGRIAGRVEFQNVSFEYRIGERVLHGIDFAVEPGQAVALVGHTGSGKSTIANLIAKLYLPSAGRVCIDGQNLDEMTSRSLHRQIACVTQQNFLFTGTILENIQVGKPTVSEAEAWQALDDLGVRDLIEALPHGLFTPIGERGVGLSSGQRQLVCFARALVAEPRVVILDEATSSVDSVTEDRVQNALARLLEGRTSFVVAHRLSTILRADQIFVLDHGRIVERGRHPELLARNGLYAKLYREFVSARMLRP